MKKIIVTGAAGYVGSILCPMLLQRGYDVTVLDTFWFWDSVEEYRNIVGYPLSNKCCIADIRDPNIVTVFNGADVVLSLASLSNDPCSDLNYNFTHDVSYNGVMNVIDCVRKSGVKKFIQTSTTNVYGPKQGKMMTERDVPNPITHYSTIKRNLDEYLQFLMKYDDMDITILRSATLYGYSPRMKLDIVVNTFLHRCITEQSMRIQGGDQCRPCLHVEDLCRAFICCIENEKSKNKLYNVVSENYSINEISDLIRRLFSEVRVHYQHVIDAQSFKASGQLIVDELGFFYTKTLQNSLQELKEKIESGNFPLDKAISAKVIQKIIEKETYDNVL